MSDEGRRQRSEWFAPAMLVGAVLVAYANALTGPFQFDDWWQIVDRPAAHGLVAWWQSLPGIRPLLKLSFALNGSLSPAPFGFHLANVLLHAANTLLVWSLARRWLARLAGDSTDHARAAFVAALVFALHPAATEAVTYISGRSLSLMATLFLASMLAQEVADDESRWRLASPILFALALAVRETAVVLPLAMLWLALCSGQDWRSALRSLRWHGAVLVVACAAMLATPGYRQFFASAWGARDFVAQWRGQAAAHAYLLLHPLLGLDSNIDPDVRVPAQLGIAGIAITAVLLALVVLAWSWRRRGPWLAFAIGWYLLQLLPANSLLPRLDLANDRHLYLALIGPALIVGVVIARWRSRDAQVLTVLVLAAVLATATMRRNGDYRSELALWTATVRSSAGKARPWANLGYARQLANDPAGAAAAYRCALAIDPRHQKAAINLMLLPEPWSKSTAAPQDCRQP